MYTKLIYVWYIGFLPWEHGDFSSRMEMMRKRWVNFPDSIQKFIADVPGMTEKLGQQNQ